MIRIQMTNNSRKVTAWSLQHFDSRHERGAQAAVRPSQKGYSEPLSCIDTNQFVGSSRGFDDVFS